MVDVVSDARLPMISLAASARIVDPANPRTKWVFKTPQSDTLMADAIAVSMKANGVRTMGYIGFADAYGDSWLEEMKNSLKTAGIGIVAAEKYNRNDTSVTGQVLKLIAAHPDAILVGASGTPAATPQKELVARGYKGRSTRRTGSPTPTSCASSGPMLVYEQLPDSNPLKKSAAVYVTQYEKRFGTRSTFGGHAWDAWQLLNQAIPVALKSGKPGTQAFRTGLRDALESANVVGVHGVFVMTPHDHNGLDNRGRVMVKIENGKWVLQK